MDTYFAMGDLLLDVLGYFLKDQFTKKTKNIHSFCYLAEMYYHELNRNLYNLCQMLSTPSSETTAPTSGHGNPVNACWKAETSCAVWSTKGHLHFIIAQEGMEIQ